MEDAEPVGVVGADLSQRFGQVHAQVVPDARDRPAELDVCPDRQVL
ncbi:hypothetical protein ACH4E7_38930 [Kitasatospora sp. NPDC018058]